MEAKMNTFNVRCCGADPYWVENVPGKGYLFCGECKSEVLQPLAVELDKHFYDQLEQSSLDAAYHALGGYSPLYPDPNHLSKVMHDGLYGIPALGLLSSHNPVPVIMLGSSPCNEYTHFILPTAPRCTCGHFNLES